MRDFNYSKLAESSWDNDILLLCSKIHEYKGRQNFFINQKECKLDRLTENTRIQSTESSNKIEGIVTTDSRFKKIYLDKTIPRNRVESEIIGYRNVLNTIFDSYEYINVTPNHILQMHRDLLRSVGYSYGGSFKNTQNYIKETKNDGTEIIRFTPLAPYETPEAVERLCKSYNETLALETVDPLILIPIFILDFLCIHPFNDGNGRMSRLLTLLLLFRSGYEVGKYVSIEKKIENTKDEYYEVLQQINEGWHEGKNNPVPFIRYMLRIILACYVEFEEKVIETQSIAVGSVYNVVKSYADRKLGKFTAADVLNDCPGIGRTSTFNALKKLNEEDYIAKVEQGKWSYYYKI